MKEQEILIEKLKEEKEILNFLLSEYKTYLQPYESFEYDYGLDKYGGIRYLREILGDKNEFKNKYIKNKNIRNK